MEIETTMLRTVMGRFSTGVAIVTSLLDGSPVAMTANAIASVSLQPPLMLWCGDRASTTLAGVRSSGVFALNFLSDAQEHLARRFSASGPKSFEGIAYGPQQSGAPVLKDCLAWLDCVVEVIHDGGDHEIVVGRVEAVEVGLDRPPLVFYRSGYHTLTP
ncbi:MAG: flavin-dependent monooxygenase reductase subunit HsaB [Actinomycetota bacterium]